ncbi:MAG TPA: response regulator [Caldimonas sp.]|nr:response regulator [Caldimonas sp.]HEV7577312.1 response regulator [Caldimonas sp.]
MPRETLPTDSGTDAEAPDAAARASADPARLIEAAPVLIWSAGLDRSNDWFSPSWSAYTGRSADDLRGDGWTRSVHPEDLDRCLGIRAASFQARAPFSMDLRLRRHDGAFRWMLDNGVPRFGADSVAIGYVGSCVDIHERKELEESLAERTQQLRLAERRQGQFLAMLSHELRNPLAPIANAASVLRTLESTNPILVRLREILERQVGRLGHLIEELIDVTRAAQGQISLVREPVSVESVVQAAVAASHDKLTGSGHRLEVDVPDERLFVRGDRGRLAQALSHLIINAAKFTFEPSAVSIGVRRAAKTVQISVIDRGEGIDPKFLPHAFELFAQQDQTLARTLGGLGVGLTLARRIAQLHGGDVEGFSEGPGRGSEFVLWLPLIEPDSAGDARDSGAPRLSESYRVLIVEDNVDALESLRLQMELWGTEVSTARNAEEALDVAADFRPQIVLCDIGLPGMDGLRLVEPLREKLKGMPVVFAAVTGYASADDQQRALDAGFDSFFVKPLNPGSLANLLRSYPSRSA